MASGEILKKQVGAAVVETRSRINLVTRTVGFLWLIEIVDQLLLGGGLDRFGVRPRELSGLVGIVLAPFLHGGISHLLANTVPLLVLGFLACSRKRMDFFVVGAASALSAGIGVWLFGAAGTVHIGASGVIFGYLGFLMGRGLFERSASTIALSAVVTMLFGGMLWGVLPIVATGISWESHLFGFLGGLLTARILGRAVRRQRKR